MRLMSLKVVIIILAVLIAVCVSLFLSVIIIKLIQTKRERKRASDTKLINPILRKLLSSETVDFYKNHGQGISKLGLKLKEKSSLKTLEDILLNLIENGDSETKVKARIIAYNFGFPEKCISMVVDPFTANIALGCRKAGLYQYEIAIPGILKALEIHSSNTQYQALMALSRIGDAVSMVQAFNKINSLIYVNERTISEILNVFSGDKYTLYKEMIHHQSDYLVRLFLKAIDKDTANTLINDVIAICKNGGKETRLACIIALGKSGNQGKAPILINALGDAEWEIRAMAAKTLGVLTDPSAILPLAKAAHDREWWVRQNAINSILAYPDCDEILVSIASSKDKFAYDSILYTLKKANETELLSRIQEVWTEKSIKGNLVAANLR